MSDLSVANVEELQKELKMYKKYGKKLRKDCVKDAPGRPRHRDEEFTDVVNWILNSRKRDRKTVDDVMKRHSEAEQELYDLKKKYKTDTAAWNEALDFIARMILPCTAAYILYVLSTASK